VNSYEKKYQSTRLFEALCAREFDHFEFGIRRRNSRERRAAGQAVCAASFVEPAVIFRDYFAIPITPGKARLTRRSGSTCSTRRYCADHACHGPR
jgi:hypothetical protein